MNEKLNEKQVLKLMVDYRKNQVEKYSQDEANEVVRQAFIELNGGTAAMNLKALRRHPEMYDLIEIWNQTAVHEGMKGNEFFLNFVEERNLAVGDTAEFVVPAKSTLIISDVAEGVQNLRRQRIGRTTTTTLTPDVKGIVVYDEWYRFLSGRIDINELTDAVSKAHVKKRMNDIYICWNGLTQSTLTSDFYPNAGTYSESALYTLMQKVEAANDGAGVILMTTPAGARNLSTAITADAAKDDYYRMGYAAMWNGVKVQIVPQRWKEGGTEFMFDDKKIYVVPATMDKPIKQVIGGESYLSITEPQDANDLSINMTMLDRWKTGLIIGQKFGVYTIS